LLQLYMLVVFGLVNFWLHGRGCADAFQRTAFQVSPIRAGALMRHLALRRVPNCAMFGRFSKTQPAAPPGRVRPTRRRIAT
jgi:hypothetical protein